MCALIRPQLGDPVARLNRRAARLAALATATLLALPLVPAIQAAGGAFAPYVTVAIPYVNAAPHLGHAR